MVDSQLVAPGLVNPASPTSTAQPPLANAERYRAIAESSFDLICELDAEGRFVYLSPSFGPSIGLETENLLGQSVFDGIPAQDKTGLVAEFTAALNGSRVGRAQHRFALGSGESRWFESVLRGIGSQNERRVVMVSREITARFRHQHELQALIALSKELHLGGDFASIPLVIWRHLHELLPLRAVVLARQNGVLELFGANQNGTFLEKWKVGDNENSPFSRASQIQELWLDNTWSGASLPLDFGLRSFVGVPLGFAAELHQGGALFFASDKPFVWTEEHARLCVMVAEQASVAVRGVQLLRAAQNAESRFRALVSDVEAIVWEAETDSLRPTFLSGRVLDWLGYEPGEVENMGAGWVKIIHPDDRESVLRELREKALSPAPWQTEFRALAKNGTEMWLRALVSPEIHEGQVVKTRGLTLDVTERRRHEDAILQTNAILQATQEASADGICLVDEKGNVVSINGRFAQMWHIPPALVEELRDRRQLMACVLSLMKSPEEFVEKMNLLRQKPGDSTRDEIALRDDRVFERYSAPAIAPDGRKFGRVWTFSDITERKSYEEQLAHQAFHDPLTDLPNRTLFLDRVEHALARLDRRGKAIAVLFFDLDRFKIINDTMGHEKGDWLLQEIGRRLHGALRPGDTAARFGGDEFTLLLEDLNGVDDAKAITERLVEAVRAPIVFEGRELEVTASIGVAMSFSRHDRAGDLLRNADIAMYRAKNKGKARFEIFDTKMSAAALERLQLEIELRQAVKWEQLKLCYQPLMDLESGKIVGMEALVRWQHPDKGLVSPSDFIPIAEESGMILPIGQWVLREACRQAKKWQGQFPQMWPLKMSVNLSAKQFQNSDIVSDVRQVLEDTELEPACLELEITETAVMEDADATIAILGDLKKLGVKLAIDDFGTGYSSLAYIERFPLDSLKLDRSFIGSIGKPHPNGKKSKVSDRSVIMQAVQTLGNGLGIEITAEGIETPEQLAEVKEMGCAIGQGFYWAKPLEHGEITRILESNTVEAEAVTA